MKPALDILDGYGSEGFLVFIIYVTFREILIPLFRWFMKKLDAKNGRIKTVRNNPGALCIAHGERLMKIELENERVARELIKLQNEIANLRSKV